VHKVLIIQSEMKHYRIPFFSGLYAALQQNGIDLKVVYSNSHRLHGLRNDRAELPGPVGKKVKGTWFFGRFIYQPLWREILRADLVIIGPEVKYLVNPILLLMSRLGLKTVAYWGLGPNRHPDRSPLAERIKEPLFTCVDWWFAYTPSISQYLVSKGMAAEIITTVYNATDSSKFTKYIEDISDEEVRRSKTELTGSAESRIGLHCGVLAEIKALPFLLESARLVKQRCPSFHLVLVGDGPDRAWLEEAIAEEPWIHYMGFKCGRESALYFKMADVFVLAGTAGLAVVDCFAAGLPLLGTDLPTHSPEISYVNDGHNGRIVPHEQTAFADSIIEVLSEPVSMERLRRGARESGGKITMEAMIQNFRLGVTKCLAYHSSVRPLGSADLAFPDTEG
jgi:L-malate glycosyltransferase